MNSLVRALAFCLLLAPLRAADLPYSTTDFLWHDASRNRDVPARIYAPLSGGPYPVIIFSHGLGGTDKGYAYLGQYWAAHGYISVHVQHPGSDSSALWGGMKSAMSDPQNYINRPKDISFAIDQVTAMNAATGDLHGKFDLGRYRLSFRYSSKAKIIALAWVNDEKTLRTYGRKTDTYAVFKRMLDKKATR